MNTNPRNQVWLLAARAPRTFTGGFTLIEMIIVIGIMAILAAMVFPIAGAANKKAKLSRARAEMFYLETAIEGYKTKLGFYPPDHAPTWAFNQLYFELLGTTNVGTAAAPIYQTLDGSAQVSQSSLGSVFTSPAISGILNCSKGGEDGQPAQSFLRDLKPGQFAELKESAGNDRIRVLQGPVPWPETNPYHPIDANNPTVNPWSYNSSNPKYNPKSFDLWVDIIISGVTNRICNWSDRPIIVSAPY